jgi:regulator of RNase E activity RraA
MADGLEIGASFAAAFIVSGDIGADSCPMLERLAFPVFAGSICVSHAYIHILEMGETVEIGGLKINSGDLLHGDIHGVQSVPIDIAAKVPAVAAKIIEQENEISAMCKSSGFSLKKLKALVSKYPA